MRYHKYIENFSKSKERRNKNQVSYGKTASGKTFNADVNGALNIMRKSSVVSLKTLYSRGDVDTPGRIRIA